METHFQFLHFQFLHFRFLHFQFLHFLCLLYLYIEDVENVIICCHTFFKISSAKVAFLMSKRKSCWHYWAQAISAPFSEKTHFPFTQHSNCVSDVWVCVSVSHMCTVFWKVTFLCTCHERYVCVCECVRHTSTNFHENTFPCTYYAHFFFFSEWYVCVRECATYVHRSPSKPVPGPSIYASSVSST